MNEGWFGWSAEFSGTGAMPGELALHFFPGGYWGLLTYPDGRTNVCGLLYRKARTKDREENFETDNESLLRKTLSPILKQGIRVTGWKGVGVLPYGRYRARHAGVFLRHVGNMVVEVGKVSKAAHRGRCRMSGPIETRE